MPYNGVYTNGEGVVLHLQFQSQANYNDWQEELMEIKHEIAAINATNQGENTRNLQYQGWLRRVEAFRVQWGNGFVPDDVKAATHSVQAGMDLPLTNW